jgi:putative transposase
LRLGTLIIYKKKLHIERLQKKCSEMRDKKKRKRLKKKIKNIYKKIKNCVSDMHHKVSKMLAETYETILLPVFKTKEMTNKRNRNINEKTTYKMLTLSHYKFRNLLEHKMNIRNGRLIECGEEYTSKTCGRCGRLNHWLNGDKVFRCPYEECDLVIDRDVNGARNIWIKNYKLIK